MSLLREQTLQGDYRSTRGVAWDKILGLASSFGSQKTSFTKKTQHLTQRARQRTARDTGPGRA